MRVLITGAAGFIGYHLGRELYRGGHVYHGIDRADGDLREAWTARAHIRHVKPDIVVHLAALVGRQFCEDDPVQAIETNANMTTRLAQECADAGVPLAYASTSEVYGDQGDDECFEDGTLAMPNGIYGLSKRWGEESCQLYAPDGLKILRLSMPYGPGLPAGRGRAAIVNMLWQAQNRQPIPVHRGAKRSWCWIGDTVHAIRLILERGEPGIYNVGRDAPEVPMLEVARLACMLTGAPQHLIHEVDPPARQTVVKRLNTTKLERLGWEPTVPLNEGMALTLEWVRRLDREPAVA
jgi:nucleoside-diphosphate-sugar epimerase